MNPKYVSTNMYPNFTLYINSFKYYNEFTGK